MSVSIDHPCLTKARDLNADHSAAGSVNTSMTLQSRDACVDATQGEFIIRSILTRGILLCGPFTSGVSILDRMGYFSTPDSYRSRNGRLGEGCYTAHNFLCDP